MRAYRNVVTINGGTFESDVRGGIGEEAKDNTVNISGTPDLTKISISGGQGTISTGNTLNWGSKGLTVDGVYSFQHYNFIAPEGTESGDTLLTVNGYGSTNLKNATVKLAGVMGNNKWKVGDTIKLIENDKGLTTDDTTDLTGGKTTQGIKRYKYELDLLDDSKNITATITGAGLGDQAKSLSEGRIASLGFINSAADLIAGGGMQSAEKGGANYDIFAAMNYGNTRLESGSHADVKGTSYLLGTSRNIGKENGRVVVGAFFEGGRASYETYNNFADAGNVYADGKNSYFGVGILARNVQNSGAYTEGSLRAGRISTDYNSNDIATQYDIRSTYYGAHIGVGRILKTSDNTELDLYGKYFWTHQNGAVANIDGDSFDFDGMDSNRLRIGARMSMAGTHNVTTYVGLAYEHEFNGSAGASTGGERIAEPSVKGGTGIGEIGIVYKADEASAFSMNLGLNGYTGKRQGISGGIKLNWGF